MVTLFNYLMSPLACFVSYLANLHPWTHCELFFYSHCVLWGKECDAATRVCVQVGTRMTFKDTGRTIDTGYWIDCTRFRARRVDQYLYMCKTILYRFFRLTDKQIWERQTKGLSVSITNDLCSYDCGSFSGQLTTGHISDIILPSGHIISSLSEINNQTLRDSATSAVLTHCLLCD